MNKNYIIDNKGDLSNALFESLYRLDIPLYNRITIQIL